MFEDSWTTICYFYRHYWLKKIESSIGFTIFGHYQLFSQIGTPKYVTQSLWYTITDISFMSQK
jgi:hypothetical protein